MVRTVGSIVTGAIAAFVVISLIELAGHAVWPLPSDLDMRDPEMVAQALPPIPLGARLTVVLAWFAGGLVGGAVAKRVSGAWWMAWPVAMLVALGGIAIVLMIPHPLWMQVAAVVAPLLGGLAATRLVRPRAGQTGQGAANEPL